MKLTLSQQVGVLVAGAHVCAHAGQSVNELQLLQHPPAFYGVVQIADDIVQINCVSTCHDKCFCCALRTLERVKIGSWAIPRFCASYKVLRRCTHRGMYRVEEQRASRLACVGFHCRNEWQICLPRPVPSVGAVHLLRISRRRMVSSSGRKR